MVRYNGSVNWVDLLIIVFLAFFTLEGLGRGFLAELLDFGSFLLAFFLSLTFYNLLSLFITKHFQIPHSLANVLGFVSIWFLTEVVFSILIHLLIFKSSLVKKINAKLRFFSVVPALLRGLIFVSMLLILVGTFPIQPQVKAEVDSSRLGKLILQKTQALEAPLKNVFGGITQDSLAFLTVEPKSNESVNLGFKTTDFKVDLADEDKMIGLVNQERTTRGLNSLALDSSLRGIARDHSADMFTRGYFSHYSPEGKTVADRAEAAGIDYLVIGENLAYAPNLELAHQGLMNSPGHRANILSKDYSKIGIGIMDGGVYGLMITQVFKN